MHPLFALDTPTDNTKLAVAKTPYRLEVEEFLSWPVTRQQAQARELIYSLERYMRERPEEYLSGAELDKVMTPIHRFTKGIYFRELTIPRGSVVVGKRHKQEHIVTLIRGSCVCFTERGREHMSAGYSFVSPAGEKRVVLATEECTWVTVHRTDNTDLGAIEEELIMDEKDIVWQARTVTQQKQQLLIQEAV